MPRIKKRVVYRMNNEEIARLSQELVAAEETRTPVAPLTDRFPGIIVADAYSIQLGIIKTKGGKRRI